MRKKDVDQFARKRPFQPFEIRLVDGQRFRFRNVEEFIVGESSLATLSPENQVLLISLPLIATIRPLGPGLKGRRRSSG